MVGSHNTQSGVAVMQVGGQGKAGRAGKERNGMERTGKVGGNGTTQLGHKWWV